METFFSLNTILRFYCFINFKIFFLCPRAKSARENGCGARTFFIKRLNVGRWCFENPLVSWAPKKRKKKFGETRLFFSARGEISKATRRGPKFRAGGKLWFLFPFMKFSDFCAFKFSVFFSNSLSKYIVHFLVNVLISSSFSRGIVGKKIPIFISLCKSEISGDLESIGGRYTTTSLAESNKRKKEGLNFLILRGGVFVQANEQLDRAIKAWGGIFYFRATDWTQRWRALSTKIGTKKRFWGRDLKKSGRGQRGASLYTAIFFYQGPQITCGFFLAFQNPYFLENLKDKNLSLGASLFVKLGRLSLIFVKFLAWEPGAFFYLSFRDMGSISHIWLEGGGGDYCVFLEIF